MRSERYAMPLWKQSTMTSYSDGANCEEVTCQVRIDRNRIVISYDHDGPTTYEGSEISPGHFRLSSVRKKGRATLHREPDGEVLEGHWIEGGYEGMWRIQLSDEE